MLSIYSCSLFLLALFFHESHAGDGSGCIFMLGAPPGSNWVWAGYQKEMDCVNACLGKRKSDKDINGATINANGDGGCWCYRKMKGRNKDSHYKSCFITDTNTHGDDRCTYLVGDAEGSGDSIIISEEYLKGSQCVDACLEKKKTNPTINGVIVRANNKPGCWCETYMKGRNYNGDYKSCFIGDTNLDGDLRCTYKPGDGYGGYHLKAGDQTGSRCVDACLILKRTYPTINGVTVYGNNYPGCWCERSMTERNDNAKWKSCIIGTEGLGKR